MISAVGERIQLDDPVSLGHCADWVPIDGIPLAVQMDLRFRDGIPPQAPAYEQLTIDDAYDEIAAAAQQAKQDAINKSGITACRAALAAARGEA